MHTILEVRGLYKRFGQQEVLRDISFSVGPGEIIGYIGPNGAGKSTTVKIILGLLEADAGEVLLKGQAIDPADSTYKRMIGYVPETAALYDTLTLREYIHFTGKLYGLSAEQINSRSLPMLEIMDLDDSLDKRLGAFSKGMRQKTLIITSLLHSPDVLFWDEPLNGLDANSVLVIKEIMARLAAQGKTIFYSSHIMETVEKLSQRILLLNEGRILADGTLQQIRGNTDVSLETFFNEVTGFTEHAELADRFVAAVTGQTVSTVSGSGSGEAAQ